MRKGLIITLRVLSGLLLPVSLLGLLLVRLSDEDEFDKYAGWALAIFVFAAILLCVAFFTPVDVAGRKKTEEELLNEIRKPNLRKLRFGKKT